MGRIEGIDPKGGSPNEAKVDDTGKLLNFSTVEDEFESVSEQKGLAYNWTSKLVDVAANGTVLLVKNTSKTHDLHIESITIDNGSTASEFQVQLPTTEVTPTGTTVTGTNLNTASSNVAEADAKSIETDNTQGNIIFNPFLAVDRSRTINTRGLIIGTNKSVAIDQVENTSEVSATIRGYYKVK